MHTQEYLKRQHEIKMCISCGRFLEPSESAVVCKLCKIIQTHNATKVRKYPTTDCYIFDSLSYKRKANDLDALGMAMLQRGYIYINLAYIKEVCTGKSEDSFIDRIMNVINHEVLHGAIFSNEGYLTSFKMDNMDMLLLLEGYLGLEENYSPERIKNIHNNYIIRLKKVLNRR